jgi:hypothetical protein
VAEVHQHDVTNQNENDGRHLRANPY